MSSIHLRQSGRRAPVRFGVLAGSLVVLPACAAQSPVAPPVCPPSISQPAAPPKAPEVRAAPAANGPHDVIIVGAGIAGLTAAKALRQANLDVVVLEATQRIGGRGITTETLGQGTFSVPIDLGGAWIHGVKTNPLTPVILGMGFATKRTEVDPSDHLFLNHAFAKEGERKKFKEAYEAFEEALEAAFHKAGDEGMAQVDKPTVNAADFLKVKQVQKLDKVSRRLLELNAGPLEGATELVNSSIEDANDFISDDDDFVQKGYGTFVEEYGADVLPLVHLGTPVTKITRRAGGVVVEAGQGEKFEGRKVLVTVSTGVLAQNKIKFEPDLPEGKKAAIKGLPMGVMDKVILEFTTPDVFPIHGNHTLKNTWVLYGGDDKAGKEDLAFVFRPMDTNIAVGFFGGQRARDLESEKDHGKATMVAIALKAMTEMCKAEKPKQDAAKCDVKAALKKAETTAWASTDWTFGSYSAALPGAAKMREKLSEPIENTVYFAGEGCYNSTYNGSFAGAYNSALRSSAAMIDCLNHEKRGEACVWHPLVAQSQ